MKNGMYMEAEIWRVAHTDQGNAVLVKPLGSEYAVPIFIGQLEAHAILIGLGSVSMPRPLTHDLILSILENFEATLEKVEITELREGAFYAELILQKGGKRFTIDSRPSDALSLAARTRCPIFIAQPIVAEVGVRVQSIVEEGTQTGGSGSPNPRDLETDRLKAKLEKALETENYEEAARLRDRLQELGAG